MCSRRVGCAVLGFVALMAFAIAVPVPAAIAQGGMADIVVVPSDPDELDDISIRIVGVWPNSCAPQDPVLEPIIGNEILIHTSNPGEICLQVLTPFDLPVGIGQLAAGDYRVTVVHHAASLPPREIAQGRFSVAVADVIGMIDSGSATRVGVCPPPRAVGNAQVRITGTLPGGGIDLRACTVELVHMLFLRSNDDQPIDQELVTDRNGTPLPSFIDGLTCRNSKHQIKCESDSKQRPTFKARISDKGLGELAFQLNVDRSVIGIDSCSKPPSGVRLETAFNVVCGASVFRFFDNPMWCDSGTSNIRTCP